jgi:hypothetical protein
MRAWSRCTSRVLLSLAVVAGAFLALLVMAAAIFQLEWTSRTWDAHAEMQAAQRVIRLGGPLYTTTADQKGPLWQLCYVAAYAIGGSVNCWFVIAGMIVLIALGTSIAAWAIAIRAGPAREVAAGAAGAFAINLILGPEEFCHELYSRNLVGFLLSAALAALVALAVARPRARTLLTLVAGVAVGLAVQTNPGSVLSALVCGGLVLWMGVRGPLAGEPRWLGLPQRFWIFGGVAAATLATAFVWFGLRGSLPDFWAEWFTYNRYYTEAGGLSYVDQVRKGLTDFAGYYRRSPYKLMLLLAFLFDAARRLRRGALVWLDVTLVAWWLAACLEVAAAQRFFDHYLILPFLPVVTMGCVLAARWGDELHVRLRPAAAIVPLVLVIMLSAKPLLRAGLEIMRHFRSPQQTMFEHVASLSPSNHRLRNFVLATSRPDDYVYAYTNHSWIYTDIDRTSATRYVEKRWLEGEIFWTGTDSDWILPRTRENWRADMRRTPPRLFITFSETPVPPGSPPAQLLSCAYRLIYREPGLAVHVLVKPIDQCL